MRRGPWTVGKTPTGRATAAVLFRSTERSGEPVDSWGPSEYADSSNAVSFIDDFFRMHNSHRLDDVLHHLDVLNRARRSAGSDGDKWFLDIAYHYFRTTARIKRSRVSDLRVGLVVARELVWSLPDRNIHDSGLKMDVVGTVYLQIAALLECRGDLVRAKALRLKVAALYDRFVDRFGDSVFHAYRLRAMGQRFHVSPGPLPNEPADVSYFDLATGAGRYTGYSQYLEVMAYSSSPPPRLLEATYEHATALVESSGYMQSGDLADAIQLKRRYNALAMRVLGQIDVGLLWRDIEIMRCLGIENEVRESIVDARQMAKHLRPDSRRDVEHMVQHFLSIDQLFTIAVRR